MVILKNAVVVKNGFGDLCLFGEVWQDERFPIGHHLLTSKIISMEDNSNSFFLVIFKTKSGTIYNVMNFMRPQDLIEYIDNKYESELYRRYLKMFIRR